MFHSTFLASDFLVRTAANRRSVQLFLRGFNPPDSHQLQLSEGRSQTVPTQLCRVGRRSFTRPKESLQGPHCPGGSLSSHCRARWLATKATEASDEPPGSLVLAEHSAFVPIVENHVKEAVCHDHPLEQLLYKGDLSRLWVQLLRETCAGLPLPRQRVWGGSYKEVIPSALPLPLRLSLSTSKEFACPVAADRDKQAGASVRCMPGGTEDRPETPSTTAVQEAALAGDQGAPISRELLLGLVCAAGVTHLLPLQQLALPLLLQRQTDVLLAAPAGTGKTLAAALAVLSHLTSEWRAHSDDDEGVTGCPNPLGCLRALIVTPTKDMAVQTRNMLGALGRYTPLRVGLLLGRGPGEQGEGNAPWRRFTEVVSKKPHVLVCTPGKAEELVHFLLAAEETGLEQTGQVPTGTAAFLSGCKLLVLEDASPQLQEPLMLRTVAKLKELLPPGHKCIALASSLSWDLQSCALRLMRVDAACLNCIEGCRPLTFASLRSQVHMQQVLAPQPPACMYATNVQLAASDAEATDKLVRRMPHTDACLAAETKAREEGGHHLFEGYRNLAEGDCRPGETPSRCDEVSGTGPGSCILDLEQPQSLWGPKRSPEFLAKKRYELSWRNRGLPAACNVAIRDIGAGVVESSRRPDEFLLYPPELHGHLLFNVLAHEAQAAARDAEAARSLGMEGSVRRVLVFFNSTKSLQFHYALFKHFLFPNVNWLLQGVNPQRTAGDGMKATRAAAAIRSTSSNGPAGELSGFEGLEDWPTGAPLPTLWALHSRLCSEKRRAVVEAFASDCTGDVTDDAPKPTGLKVLFCTDVAAVGVQLGPAALVLQIGAPKSVELYVQRAARAPRLARKLLALSDLDGHFLYECYKERIPLHEASAATSLPLLRPNKLFAAALGGSAEAIAYRSAVQGQGSEGRQPQADTAGPPSAVATNAAEAAGTLTGGEAVTTGRPATLGAFSSGLDVKEEDALVESNTSEHKAVAFQKGSSFITWGPLPEPRAWLEARPLRASCELMYRSLLGTYALQATRLKFERWQVPSFINAMLLSIGVDEPPAVTKQMAARLQLMQAPGLTVDYHATSKTELLAALPSCPGFLSRWRQLRAEGPPPLDVSSAFGWSRGDDSRTGSITRGKDFNTKSGGPTPPPATESLSSILPKEQEIPTFASVSLYPPLLP